MKAAVPGFVPGSLRTVAFGIEPALLATEARGAALEEGCDAFDVIARGPKPPLLVRLTREHRFRRGMLGLAK